MDLQKKFGVWLCCMALVACAVPPKKVQQTGSTQQQLIARDLVGMLAQIELLPKSNTTLNLPAEYFGNDGFSVTLQSQLEEVGFGIRMVDSDDVQKLVSYSVESSINEAGKTVSTYTVNVDDVGVRRSYELIDAVQVRPTALMQVRGADAARLRIDDSLFANNDTESAPASTPGESAGEAKAERNMPAVSARQSRQPPRNYRDLGQSNFTDLLSSYRMVDEVILLFDNDSVRLGQSNKVSVTQFVSLFDPVSDVFSVIGCSNGSTSVDGGPKVLALGRGERVRQELLYAGVPDENILFEGCWSDEYYDEKMPRRAVVLSLQRRAE